MPACLCQPQARAGAGRSSSHAMPPCTWPPQSTFHLPLSYPPPRSSPHPPTLPPNQHLCAQNALTTAPCTPVPSYFFEGFLVCPRAHPGALSPASCPRAPCPPTMVASTLHAVRSHTHPHRSCRVRLMQHNARRRKRGACKGSSELEVRKTHGRPA